MPKLETKPIGWFKEEPQARQHYDEAELRLLGQSLKQRQLQPVLARPDGTIIAGHRRFRAAKLVGLESLQVIIVEGDLTPAQVRGIQLTENIHRADLTGYEKWLACKELLELNPGWQGKDLAEHLHLDPSSVTRLLSPSKCIPEAVEALKAGKITISDSYALSKLSHDDQPSLLELKWLRREPRHAGAAGAEEANGQRARRAHEQDQGAAGQRCHGDGGGRRNQPR